MSDKEQAIEEIGQAVDRLDNLIAANEIPMPADIRLGALNEALPELRDQIKSAYMALGGEDWWSEP